MPEIYGASDVCLVAQAAATGAIQDTIRLVEVFGVHMLSIDLRQHSARHTQA